MINKKPILLNVIGLLLFACLMVSCQTKQSCTSECRYGKAEEISKRKKINAKRTAKELQKSTLTGMPTKEIDLQNNPDLKKNTARKKKSKIYNNPIL